MTLEKRIGQQNYSRKELTLKLIHAGTQQQLGTAIVNLAEYSHCTERYRLAVDITDCKFPDARFRVSLTARHKEVIRPNTGKAVRKSDMIA